MTTKPVMSIIGAKDAVNAVTALLGTSALMLINSGSQPATTLTADSGTNLANPVPDATAVFPNATSGTGDGLATATANAIASDTSAANSGTAGYFRLKTSGGVTIFQGNVGTSGADLNMNTTTISAGDTVAITSLKVTLQCGDGVT